MAFLRLQLYHFNLCLHCHVVFFLCVFISLSLCVCIQSSHFIRTSVILHENPALRLHLNLVKSAKALLPKGHILHCWDLQFQHIFFFGGGGHNSSHDNVPSETNYILPLFLLFYMPLDISLMSCVRRSALVSGTTV